jgi:hypothetical protein
MKDVKVKTPSNPENSKSVVEAAIDLSRSTKDGTWEDVVRKSSHQPPYSKAVHPTPQPETLEKER